MLSNWSNSGRMNSRATDIGTLVSVMILGICRFICLSNHQHYPAFSLDEGVREAHRHGINLGRRHRLSVLAHMQLLAVDDFRNLLRAKAPLRSARTYSIASSIFIIAPLRIL